MKLFVSYARVDKPYCTQIVNTLHVHEVWLDARLYAGQGWWNEILRRLEWCEGFIYLLSPESVASEYCRREFKLAMSLGRDIFPVIIHPNVEIPVELRDLHYIDMSRGLTAENVGELHSAIYLAQQTAKPSPPPHGNGSGQHPQTGLPPIDSDTVNMPQVEHLRVVGLAAQAMQNGQYDRAVYLLRQAKANGYESRFIKIDKILEEAETALELQVYVREADREYQQIADLITVKRTEQLGCEAFQSFQEIYPDYDPKNLAEICKNISTTPPPSGIGRTSILSLPLLEWCDIPDGNVIIDSYDKNDAPQRPLHVDAFKISRFPVTMRQFEMFIDAKDGYQNAHWWQLHPQVLEWWRRSSKRPMQPAFKDEDRPREMVNWFEAMAFCNWLSDRLGMKITLPTVEQRQRSIQGDDDRIFPWGHDFDPAKCNTRESEIKMTTKVIRYQEGASSYGVFDLVGNVWEWCHDGTIDVNDEQKRAVHGGSFVSPFQRAKLGFRYYLNPQTHYASIGFRIVQL